MPLLFRIIAQAVRHGCSAIRLRTLSRKVEVRIEGCSQAVTVEQTDEILDRSTEEGVQNFTLASQNFDFRRLELQKRLNSAPVPVFLNGSQLNHGLDMARANDYVVSRRYFLGPTEEAQFCTQPVWGAQESNFELEKKTSKLCWKQDAYLLTEEGPQEPPEGGALTSVGGGYQGLPCVGMVALGYNQSKPSVIHWIDHGVWLDSQEVDLGFPGAWAVCSAHGLPGEGFQVKDSKERAEIVSQARREIDYLVMDTVRFRDHPYPKFPSISRTLFILAGLGAGWYTGLLWPFLAGPAIGEGLEWFHHRKARSRFWAAVDDWQSSRARSIVGPQDPPVEG